MPRRQILTDRQRSSLFDLPTDSAALLHHYTLSDDDLEQIRRRRQSHNRLGFALQLCAFRYPGRLLSPGEMIPLSIAKFIAAQLGEKADDLCSYAETDVTRRRHLVDLRAIYGYKMFTGQGSRELILIKRRDRLNLFLLLGGQTARQMTLDANHANVTMLESASFYMIRPHG